MPTATFAVLTNPPQGTSVTVSETINYTTTVNANSVNNLNINNSAAGQTYTVNVQAGGNMSNSTFFRDIMNLTGSQSFNVFVTVFNGGAITHNSTTKEFLDDDASGAGISRVTVNAGGNVTGRFNGSVLRSGEIINAGTINGDHQTLTVVNNSGNMFGGGITLNNAGTLTNTGTISGNISGGGNSTLTNSATINGSVLLSTNDILNNNGAGTISGSISGSTGAQFRIGPSSSNNFTATGGVTVPTVQLLNASSLTIANGGSVGFFTTLSGSRPITVQAGGTLGIDVSNSLTNTGALANSGTIRVGGTFNPSTPSSFTNPNGTIEVYGAGAITGNISASGTSTFRLGNGFNTSTYTTQGTITNFATINVATSGSSLTANHLISGVNTGFTVANGAFATLNVAPTGSGAFTNNGTVTTGVANAIGLTGVFTNNGTLNVNHNLSTTSFATPINASTGIIHINNVTFTTNASFTNNGTINVNNAGGAISGALIGGTGSTLNIGPDVAKNFVASSTITGINSINVLQGSFSSAFAVTGVNNTFSVSSGQSATFTAALSGSGTVQNAGTFTLGASSSLGSFVSVTNTGTFLVTGNSTNNTPITNSNIMTISNTLSGSGTISNTGTLTFSASANNNNAITNDGIFNVSGAATNTAVITNNATMTISNTLAGAGSIVNAGTLTFAASTNNSNNVTNNNILNVSGASTNNAVITNTSQMTISSSLAGGGSILTSGTLTFAAGTVNSNAVTNTGIFNVSGASSNAALLINNSQMTISDALSGAGSITNNGNALTLATGTNTSHAITNSATGTLNITGSVTTSAITNSGSMTIGGDIDMPGQVLNTTGTGSVTINGQRAITATSYTNAGDHNTTITNASVYDSLTVTGAANLAGCVLTVSAPTNPTGTWTILSATGALTAPASIVLPQAGGGLFGGWRSNIVGNSIVISAGGSPFASLAEGTVNIEIADVLDLMVLNTTNSGQQILIDAFTNSTSIEAFNASLQAMRPSTNTSSVNIMLQSKIFSRIENRIASIHRNTNMQEYGIAAGDCSPTTAFWIGGFGSYARQNSIEENLGYDSTAFGSILGLDTLLQNDGILGLGVGLSKTIIHENVSPNFVTSVIGYHALAYGTKLLRNSTFLEWLATGAYVYNKGSRMINVSGVVMSTTSANHGGQGALRLNYGVECDFGTPLIFAPLATMQYAASYTPNYDENFTPAALHVSQTNYQDILTVGAGTRISYPCDEWWLMGTREIRFMGTYDVISSTNNFISNFLVGSSTFSIINPAVSRFALRAGIDISVKLFSSVNLQFSYDYELRSRYYDHSGAVKIKFLF